MALRLGVWSRTFTLSADDHRRVRNARRISTHLIARPVREQSLIWFTVWSSVVHAVIMGVQGLTDVAERGHLVGDVPALSLVAIVLAVLMTRTATVAVQTRRTAQA
jgi:Family of unknown function (DUF6632)